ncbi:sensor histidine kinase [Alcaligenes pakistanensis]|uniref:histidine kinase n=1 Tax=Alcaligenes pakistanensis TaxID=1482717 RepID=A0A8H9IMH9_9BURK|nr:sensor histidine kinase [Alcaligenes pakistanensis]GHC47432.1 sensor histidine kinase [Alcaligenes pakistanensis]HCA18167.1 sensor histidine kinase [Alcaligenes faecalis]
MTAPSPPPATVWQGSLRFWLLVLLIPGVVALLLYDSWEDYLAMNSVTENVYDSALLEPAKVLETSVEFNTDGSLRIDPPFYAQVMLESRPGNRKYFRVEEVTPLVRNLGGADAKQLKGRTLLGMEGLPRPSNLADHEGVPVFYDSYFRNDTVRMVALWRDLHYKGQHRQVLVMVGESMDLRLRTQQEAWREGIFRNLRMLLFAVLLVWFAVAWALRPLQALRQEVRNRSVEDLQPLDERDVPREVVPLVRSVNHHIELYRSVLDRQAQFLADASHQLRTPLAIIHTQAQYARREPDIERVRESLGAIIKQLGQATRLTEQLLALAHASHTTSMSQGQIDLASLGREVVLQYLPLAREHRQDLGWIGPGEEGEQAPLWVYASDAEIHESVSNLIHNAINHAGSGSAITVSAGHDDKLAWISVTDNGMGLAASLRESVFVRFDRGGPARKGGRGSGSGLGLAIALAYAERNGGTIVLTDGEPNDMGGYGLKATLRLPLLAPESPNPSPSI